MGKVVLPIAWALECMQYPEHMSRASSSQERQIVKHMLES